MVALGIVSLLGLIFASMISQQHREIRALLQRSDRLEFEIHMKNTMSRVNICTWQMAAKTVDLSTTTPTVKSPSVIDFGTTPLYEGLDATSSVLAVAGTPLSNSTNGVVVEKIFFKDITATGIPNQYKGFFEIKFLNSTLVRPLPPVRVQQVFTTDNASASAAVQYCGSGLLACPAGFVLVGNPNEISSFCIEKDTHGAVTSWYNAQNACIGLQDPELGRARLCTWSEWKTACNYGTGINSIGSIYEWVSESYSADNLGFVVGNPSCNIQYGAAINSSTSSYRCCYRR